MCGGCAQTCIGDAEVLLEKWESILYHVVNKDKWRNCRHFCKCTHGHFSRNKKCKTKWLQAGSAAHIALEEAVLNKKLSKDITKPTKFHHTGKLKVPNFLVLKCLKVHPFFTPGEHNCPLLQQWTKPCNCQLREKQGLKKYKITFPKGRKSWVVIPVLEKKVFNFIQHLMDDVMSFQKDQTDSIPKSIGIIPRPNKDDVIAAQISHMAKT